MDTDTKVTVPDEFVVGMRACFDRIDTHLDHIEVNMVTRADLANFSVTMIKWIAGMVIGAGLVAITVMAFVLDGAMRPSVAPAPAPIVIQLNKPVLHL